MASNRFYMKCTLSTALILLAWAQRTAASPPNILLVVADDYGWNDVGYHGSEIETPVLDQLAGEGVKLENYYVQPVCTPSRSQLLSGRYQIHTGLQHEVIKPSVPNGLPLDLPTLPQKLKELGYSTHMVGKWHLGFYQKEYLPTNRGFDSHYGYYTGAEDYFTHTRSFNDFHGLDLHDNLKPVLTENGSYSAELFARKAQEIVQQHAENNSNQPIFLYLPFQSVHGPLQVPEKYTSKYKFIKNQARRTYAGMVSALDEAIGNITATMQKAGLWNNTLMVFSTDNGGQVRAGGNNWPLKGWKASLWEGGIRGVGFVHGAMLKKPGSWNQQLLHISDWFPTLLSVAGGSLEGLTLDGFNVWDAISSNVSSPRKEILHNIDPLHPTWGQQKYKNTFDTRIRAALRMGDWKILTGDPGVTQAIHVPPPLADYDPDSMFYKQSLRWNEDDDDRITSSQHINKKHQNVWLYNIRVDPYEYNDVSEEQPDVVRRMLTRLAEYNSTAVPCRFPPSDPKANPALHGGVWGPWE